MIELEPGVQVGAFRLGTSLFESINFVREQRDRFQVQFAFNEASLTGEHAYLRIKSPSLTLRFDATQRLDRIEASDPADFVSFKGKALKDGATVDALRDVRRLFGPTYSSSSDESRPDQERLLYPGVAFYVSKSNKALLKMIVFPYEPNASIEAAFDSCSLYDALSKEQLRMCAIHLGQNLVPSYLSLDFYCNEAKLSIRLGKTSYEDLLCDLGNPIRSFYKEDQRLAIHAGNKAAAEQLNNNAYFLSWPHFGLTFLMDGTRHVVLKAILHSNLPGEISFGRTARCNWHIQPATGASVSSSQGFAAIARLFGRPDVARAGRAIPGATAARHLQPSNDTRSTSASPSSKSSKGSARSKQQQDASPASPARSATSVVESPMILDRSVDGTDNPVLAKTTEIHGFPGIAFEMANQFFPVPSFSLPNSTLQPCVPCVRAQTQCDRDPADPRRPCLPCEFRRSACLVDESPPESSLGVSPSNDPLASGRRPKHRKPSRQRRPSTSSVLSFAATTKDGQTAPLSARISTQKREIARLRKLAETMATYLDVNPDFVANGYPDALVMLLGPPPTGRVQYCEACSAALEPRPSLQRSSSHAAISPSSNQLTPSPGSAAATLPDGDIVVGSPSPQLPTYPSSLDHVAPTYEVVPRLSLATNHHHPRVRQEEPEPVGSSLVAPTMQDARVFWPTPMNSFFQGSRTDAMMITSPPLVPVPELPAIQQHQQLQLQNEWHGAYLTQPDDPSRCKQEEDLLVSPFEVVDRQHPW